MATPPEAASAPVLAGVTGPGREAGEAPGFSVSLEVFSGPFDLLLSLITKHKLDITEVALAQVTDEFIAYMNALDEWDLSQASDFLVIAATLLDLKAARLLPGGLGDDEEDLELLEARDLLFARLLQYRAFKEVAAAFGTRLREQEAWRAHPATIEPHFAALVPELVLALGPDDLAQLAAAALTRQREEEGLPVAHLHAPAVSVREQAAILADRLRRGHAASFRALVSDAGSPLVVVARFLALLELYREGAVSFDQAEPLAELTIRWSPDPESGMAEVNLDAMDDYDGEPGESSESSGPDGPGESGGPGSAGPRGPEAGRADAGPSDTKESDD